jgi:threonine dehydrogenase-like Zn-dependent dehydrogenase
MRVLIEAAAAPDAMRLATRERPVPGPGELLLQVEAVGICGTDLSLYAWHQEIVDLYHVAAEARSGTDLAGGQRGGTRR